MHVVPGVQYTIPRSVLVGGEMLAGLCDESCFAYENDSVADPDVAFDRRDTLYELRSLVSSYEDVVRTGVRCRNRQHAFTRSQARSRHLVRGWRPITSRRV